VPRNPALTTASKESITRSIAPGFSLGRTSASVIDASTSVVGRPLHGRNVAFAHVFHACVQSVLVISLRFRVRGSPFSFHAGVDHDVGRLILAG
jgi:predicted aconitase with swiveling domain